MALLGHAVRRCASALTRGGSSPDWSSFSIVTYWLWQPLAPAYTQFLLRASQVGVWLTEFSSDPHLPRITTAAAACNAGGQSHRASVFYQRRLFPARALAAAGHSGRVGDGQPGAADPADAGDAGSDLARPLRQARAGAADRRGAAGGRRGDRRSSRSTRSHLPGAWSPFCRAVYQFLDAFVQSWDTQLFPFVIWAGINFRQILPPTRRCAHPAPAPPRATRRRRAARRRPRAERAPTEAGADAPQLRALPQPWSGRPTDDATRHERLAWSRLAVARGHARARRSTIDPAKVVDLTYGFGAETVYWPTGEGLRRSRSRTKARRRAATGTRRTTSAPPSTAARTWTRRSTSRTARRRTDQVPVDRRHRPAGARRRQRRGGARPRLPPHRRRSASLGERPTAASRPARSSSCTAAGATRWPDQQRYLGTDEPGDVANLHFPGFSKEAAEWLVDERDIKAIGVDTPSIDHGPSQDFIVHRIINGANKPAFENLANLDRVPRAGRDADRSADEDRRRLGRAAARHRACCREQRERHRAAQLAR